MKSNYEFIMPQNYLSDTDNSLKLGEDLYIEFQNHKIFNYRKDLGAPVYIMQHHTPGKKFPSIAHSFNKIVPSMSTHYVIKKSGEVEEIVKPYYKAYHAGIGKLEPNSKLNPGIFKNNDMNSWSIAIQNVNNGQTEYTNNQIKANVLLCQSLCEKYPTINPKLMLGHSDWVVGKKAPGPYFPWDEFANAKDIYEDFGVTKNFGIYPRIRSLDLKKNPEVIFSYEKYCKYVRKELTEEQINNIQECRWLLQKYGYPIDGDEVSAFDVSTQNALIAYNLHFNGRSIKSSGVWNDLCHNSSDSLAKAALSEFTENDMLILGDVLDQF